MLNRASIGAYTVRSHGQSRSDHSRGLEKKSNIAWVSYSEVVYIQFVSMIMVMMNQVNKL